MIISVEGTCVQWQDCMQTKNNRQLSQGYTKAGQTAYIEKHNVFMSGGRVYAKLEKYIVDAITGTLYWLDGKCVNTECDLFVDVNDITTRDKKTILEFVRSKY